MNQVLLTLQIIGQVAWGVNCFYNSPQHLILFALNFVLASAAIASNIAADKAQSLFFTIYFALLVIPIFAVLFTSLSALYEMLALTLQNLSNVSAPPLLDNPIQSSVTALQNYIISMLIAPGFRLLNWSLHN